MNEYHDYFDNEKQFESEVIKCLQEHGWEKEVLSYKTEDELIDNWANILFENNRDLDRLNGCPLTHGEKKQLIDLIKQDGSPFALNKLINGRTLSIIRDNPKDTLHFGKAVSLSIYDRNQIAGGKSRYQIAQQPVFKKDPELFGYRRGDLSLLINGMPVIHIELKKSSVPCSQAIEQIRKYHEEGIFEGLFSLVQIFVAMTPDNHRYFANPGYSGFNPKFYYQWADTENKICKSWRSIVETLLFIPMAHMLVGFYTVPDKSDRKLKVLRSYQITAVEKIKGVLNMAQWTRATNRGGYIFHTTGSGKTLTSFRAASLVANDGTVDKSVFMADRTELGLQTFTEYQNFASGTVAVQDTDDTEELCIKLLSDKSEDKLIVTSIQKMDNLSKDAKKKAEVERIASKHCAFIIDECHRSTFGKMLNDIKDAFPTAKYFGFSGTPIYDENSKNRGTTRDLFGSELCRYTIAHGLRDGNVLPFDIRMQSFDEMKLREVVALDECKAKDAQEALNDPEKLKIYQQWMDRKKTSMVEVEKKIPKSQYEQHSFREKVVDNVLKDWDSISVGKKFHAIFAASSIPEAIEYYRIFKQKAPNLKVTAIFDQHEGNNENSFFKEKAIFEILDDYNKTFSTPFTITKYDLFKRDVSIRLAHKDEYECIDNNREKQLDLVIVVDMLLTGYDSRWVIALYLDKMLEDEHIVQAFSRTNRIVDDTKPFGVIKYYRYPHTMKKKIEAAFKLYSGDRASDMFVSTLYEHLEEINQIYSKIRKLFESEGIENFNKLPQSEQSKVSFSKLFPQLKHNINAASVQDFRWNKSSYLQENRKPIEVDLTKETYDILETRYKELFNRTKGPSPTLPPYDFDTSISEYSTERVDFDYMNSRFDMYIRVIQEDSDPKTVEQFRAELSRSFAKLSSEDQGIASKIVSDLASGLLNVRKNATFKEYLLEYKNSKKVDEINRVASAFGIDAMKLREIIESNPNEGNYNEFKRFDHLVDNMNNESLAKAKEYLESRLDIKIPPVMLKTKIRLYLKDYILNKGFDA